MNPLTATAWVGALFLAASLFSHTVALRLSLLAVGIVLAGISVARSKGEIRALPPIWIAFAAWGAWAALSLLWSAEPERSQKELHNEVLYTGFALWICYLGAQARNAARIFLPVMGAAAPAVCAVALWEFSRGPVRYSIGLHGGPGNHSSTLLLLMPCALMAGWYAARARWPLPASFGIWALVALMVASAYATLNRTIWLGFVAEFILLAFLLMRGRTAASGASKRVFVLLVSGSVVACGAIVLNIQAEREAIGIAKTVEEDPRLALWPEIVEKVAERPLTGFGFGRGVLRSLLLEQLGTVDRFLWHAHNLFLEALLQTGFPGLILLLALLGAIVREGWRFARDADESTAAASIALLGVVAGMLVRNMTDTLLIRQNSLLFWGVVGVLLALGTKSGRARS
jgi:O-antigen ligase